MPVHTIEEPTPDLLRYMLKRHKLTQPEAAKLLHVTPKAVEKWLAPIDSKEHRDMSPALFELLLLKLDEHPTMQMLSRGQRSDPLVDQYTL